MPAYRHVSTADSGDAGGDLPEQRYLGRESFRPPEDDAGVYMYHVGSDFETVSRDVLARYPDQSFCFLNVGKLRQNAGVVQDNFLPWHDQKEVAYAVKANPRRRILEVLAAAGITSFDCASPSEIERVQMVSPEARILFNNPIKASAAVKFAADRGVNHFTVQTGSEIDRVVTAAVRGVDNAPLELVARLRTPNDGAAIDFSDKYGATAPEVEAMIAHIRSKVGCVPGISVHVGSQNSDAQNFVEAIRIMSGIAAKMKGVKIMNIGGGIPVNYDSEDTFDTAQYLAVISDAVTKYALDSLDSDHSIIIELGRALVAEAVDLVVPVHCVTQRDGKDCVYIGDGIYGSFSDSVIHGWKYRMLVLADDFRVKSPAKMKKYVVFGGTCDSKDTLGEVQLPDGLKDGDHLWVPNAGAYMDSQSTHFCGFAPPLYVAYNLCGAARNLNGEANPSGLRSGVSARSIPPVFSDVRGLKGAVSGEFRAIRDAIPIPAAKTLNVGNFRVDYFTSDEITPDLMDKVADYFRYIFDSDFPELLVCQNCGWHESARDTFHLQPGENAPLDVIDAINGFPPCPDCSGVTEFFHHPQATRRKIEEKLGKDGYLTLVRGAEGEAIQGFNFGYVASLDEVFRREWAHKFMYTQSPASGHYRDEAAFMRQVIPLVERMQKHNGVYSPVSPETKVLCWNCTALGPAARSSPLLLLNTLSHFFNSLPPEIVEGMVTVGETVKKSNYYSGFKRSKEPLLIDEDFLGEDRALMVAPVRAPRNYMDNFLKKLAVRASRKTGD